MYYRLLRCLQLLCVCSIYNLLTPTQTWAQPSTLQPTPLELPAPELLANLDTLMVHGDFVDIRIRPSRGAVEILWSAQAFSQTSANDALQQIETGVLLPSLSVSESRLIIRAESTHTRYFLDIALPATWQYQLRIYGAGDIDTAGISGELTAWSARGNITVLEQAGRVSLTAMDGVTRAQLLASALTGSCAITMNHGVARNNTLMLALPESASTTIRVQARGPIQSDIPGLPIERVDTVAQDSSQVLEMQFNGGGPALSLRNLQGAVQLLRALPE